MVAFFDTGMNMLPKILSPKIERNLGLYARNKVLGLLIIKDIHERALK